MQKEAAIRAGSSEKSQDGTNAASEKGDVGKTSRQSEAEEMAAFREEFYAELERIPKNETIINLAVNISEEAFKNMKADPAYREQILSVLRRDLTSSFAPTGASLLITVGADAKDYRGDSWSGAGNDSEFYTRSRNGFYKKTNGQANRRREIREQYLEKEMQAKKYREELLNEKAGKQEAERSSLERKGMKERQMVKAFNVYEASEVFQGDITLGAFQLSKNREAIMDKIEHTVMQSATAFSDMRAGILKEIREEKGYYDHDDIMNACEMVYAKLYSEIEQRYEDKQEQYYKADGTPLTKEEEIGWLDMQYEQEMKWQNSVARTAAQGQVYQGRLHL